MRLPPVHLWALVSKSLLSSQVFLVRKILGPDAGQLYAMKVLKKASLKGKPTKDPFGSPANDTHTHTRTHVYVGTCIF